jgi:MFS family permease
MVMISFCLFLTLREGNIPAKDEGARITLKSGFAQFGEEWKSSKSLGCFVVSRALFMLIFVAIPFLSVRALQQTGEQSGLLGMLVIPQMLGAVLGNGLTGILGDRQGVRFPMLCGRLVLILALTTAMLAVTPWHFMAVFFFIGMGISTGHVGDLTMVFDFAPPPGKGRKFFFAVIGTLIVPGVLTASLLSAGLQYVHNGFYLACGVSVAGLMLSLYFLYHLADPRQRLI